MAKLLDITNDEKEQFVMRMNKKTETKESKSYIFDCLDKIDKILYQIKSKTDELRHLLKADMPDNFFVSNSVSELIQKTRYMVDTINKLSCESFNEVCEIKCINAEKLEFTQEGEHLHIACQSLLPKRISDNHSIYNKTDIISMYEPAFRSYFRENKRFVYNKKAVIIYTHYFTDDKNLIDHDNFETKIITDIITSYIFYYDSSKFCSVFMDYRIGEHEHTEIDIVPFESFKDYI